MKSKTKALIVAPVLVISLALALLMFPSAPRGARFVLANPSFPTSTTRILLVKLMDDGTLIADFLATGETKYAEVGQKIDKFYASVLISLDYADSESDAMANTKVHGTISHPTAGTVFTGYLTVTEAIYWGDHYVVRFENSFSEHTLVAGTYTVTTIYQIYA